jgi:DNA-directed RNA polymerase subunit RPC12/RpoP
MKAEDVPGIGGEPHFCEECGYKILSEKGVCSRCGAQINLFKELEKREA